MAIMLEMTWVCSLLDVCDGTATRVFPCPDDNPILPCVCSDNPNQTLDMDCSEVTSSDQLAGIFSIHFPFNDFDNLFIKGNPYIRTLRVGDLGDVSFSRIHITSGRLESVVRGALETSYSTLISLDLSGNHVTDFPFDEISSYWHNDELNFRYNALATFQRIQSSTLRSVQMGYNPLKRSAQQPLMICLT